MRATMAIDPPGRDRNLWVKIIHELAIGDTHCAIPVADSPNARHWLADFTRGNLLKRIDKLQDQLDLPANPFPDLKALLERYVREVPLRAFDIGTTDGARFARWLWRHFSLTAQQRDALRVVRSRCAVEHLARCRRLAYLRFHEWHQRSVSEQIDWQRAIRRGMRLMLNPVRVWTAFETRVFLDDEPDATAESLQTHSRQPRRLRRMASLAVPRGRYPVVFFAVAGEIGSVELSDAVRPVLEMLAHSPLRALPEWVEALGAQRVGNPEFDLEDGDFVELVEAGVACGLFAFVPAAPVQRP